MVKKIVKKASNKNIPVGIKILSILNYIGFVLFVLVGIALIILGIYSNNINLEEYKQIYISSAEYQKLLQENPELAQQSIEFYLSIVKNLIYIGVFFIILAIVSFFIARGLWNGQNWARILEAIFSAFGLITAILSLFSGNFIAFLSLALNSLIVWYLLFNKNVLRFFNVK